MFFENADSSSKLSSDGDDGTKISVTSIDTVCKNENVSYIKMDIEGSELEALKGAKATIERCKPKLAICVYHKKEDLITIPQYIRSGTSVGKDYKFYLRYHGVTPCELVLYAIPVK